MTEKQAKKRILTNISLAWLALVVFFGGVASAAPTYVSPSYGVDEIQFGAGGTNDWNSAN